MNKPSIIVIISACHPTTGSRNLLICDDPVPPVSSLCQLSTQFHPLSSLWSSPFLFSHCWVSTLSWSSSTFWGWIWWHVLLIKLLRLLLRLQCPNSYDLITVVACSCNIEILLFLPILLATASLLSDNFKLLIYGGPYFCFIRHI